MSGPLSALEVAQLLLDGEDSFTEFKADGASNETVAKELCAFLNAEGGRVLLGVEDDGTAGGLGNWDEERIMNVARTLLDPPVVPTWQSPEVGGRRIGVVHVDHGTEKPYAVRRGEAKRYYVRVGTTSREASRDELIRLTQASGAVQADLRPVPGSSAADLDEARLVKRFGDRRTLAWHELDGPARLRVLRAAEIVRPDDDVLTVAGLVCLAADPQRRISHATVTCAAYPTPGLSGDLLDQAVAGGPVDEQVRQAAAFVERNLRSASAVVGAERMSAPRPSMEVLREIIANAVAHRDYGIAGTVHLRVFSDGLEVVSPGRLPNGVDEEAMRVGVSVRRNPFVVDHLVGQRLVDALGRGIVLLVEEHAALGLPEPVIDAGASYVRVRLRW